MSKTTVNKKEQTVVYGDRETLDAELASAVNDILSAEQEAKRIIAQAEETVKSVQLDYSVREREMREGVSRLSAEARDKALHDAAERAEKERQQRVAAAEKEGAGLLKTKGKTIDELVKKLYASLGGKA